MTAHPPIGARLQDVGVRYGATAALDGATFDVRPGVITGLLGRNGSGKTTALSLLASYRRPSSGRVMVGGRDPFEHAPTHAAVCLIRESGDFDTDDKVKDVLELWSSFRPAWDQRWAEELLDRFEVSTTRGLGKLSRGKRSVVGAVVGLASRAPLTMFDEVHLGMDAPTRVAFYDLLVADYAAHPRTIVVSSHLISEIEHILERVVVLDAGRVVADTTTDELRSMGARLTGRADVVRAAAADHRVLAERELGPTAELTVVGLDDAARTDLAARGIGVEPVGLQDIVIHLTGSPA
ncbi:ATP-binding cassette domain-containing protein [Georgenia sp. Z1491]|uniref:ATP-binding cassette domain-containing protein n=1 Tax=Georgenia sp. Z1491 TaxID=3416707 RepID=UPI003CF343E2